MGLTLAINVAGVPLDRNQPMGKPFVRVGEEQSVVYLPFELIRDEPDERTVGWRCFVFDANTGEKVAVVDIELGILVVPARFKNVEAETCLAPYK